MKINIEVCSACTPNESSFVHFNQWKQRQVNLGSDSKCNFPFLESKTTSFNYLIPLEWDGRICYSTKIQLLIRPLYVSNFHLHGFHLFVMTVGHIL